MHDTKSRLLFIEDDKVDQLAFDRFARKENFPYEYVMANDIEEALSLLQSDKFDTIVTDYLLGDGNAFDLLNQVNDTPIIIVTGKGDEEIAVSAMKKGAYDYLIKDMEGNHLKTLAVTVERAIARKRTEQELRLYQERLEELVQIRTHELQQEIEERKRIEDALQKAHDELEMRVKERTAELTRVNTELASASRLKDEFLANMSHELRTPLHVTLGLLESLQEQVYGNLTDQQLHVLHTIEENSDRLLELITDILDLSKIIAGEFELSCGPQSLTSICQESMNRISHLAQKKQIRTSFVFQSKIATVYADKRRLKQALGNLLNNAVKFTPEGGEIGLSVEYDQENQQVKFVVWDTGIGIPKDKMNMLFKPFVQLDGKLSRRYSGTGLGLSLAYHIVDIHGGGIALESEVGKGSRFIVSLPVNETEKI